MPTSTTLKTRPLPLGSLGAFPDLYETYCTDYDQLAPFYAGDWRDRSVWAERARAAAERERDRDTLVDVLEEQNRRWQEGELDETTAANLERLRDPNSAAVVTGQQVGLFSGPGYTLYKTLTMLRLAEEMERETGRAIVPVFWVEGEDHDFEEIASVSLLRRNEIERITYAPDHETGRGPVGRLELTEAVETVLDELEEMLPPSDFRPALIEALRESYRPGVKIEDAFVRFVQRLLPESGIVYLNADDARLKQLVAPLVRREIEDPRRLDEALQAQSERIAERFHAQVHIQPTNFFLLTDEGRLPLDAEGDGFVLRGTDRRFTQEELLQKVEEKPEAFSPNVVTRPLVQDALVPTAAYVAGPGEISYFAQYRPAYEWAEIPMPVIYPRASLTLMESKVQKVLDRYELQVGDFQEGVDSLFQRVVLDEMEVDVEAVFGDAMTPMHKAINDLKPAVEEVDRTLIKTVEATRAALIKEMNQLKSRVVRAEKRQHDEVRAQLDKAHVNIYPNGGLQERTISPLYYLNKYSLRLVDELREAITLETDQHYVVEL